MKAGVMNVMKNSRSANIKGKQSRPVRNDASHRGDRLLAKGLRHAEKGRRAEALECYMQAARLGNAVAAYNAGCIISDARGAKRDPAAAVRLWRIAARLGDPDAKYNLAWAYRRGFGVPSSTRRAFLWTKAAAEGGILRGQFNLAQAYVRGNGTKQDNV